MRELNFQLKYTLHNKIIKVSGEKPYTFHLKLLENKNLFCKNKS